MTLDDARASRAPAGRARGRSRRTLRDLVLFALLAGTAAYGTVGLAETRTKPTRPARSAPAAKTEAGAASPADEPPATPAPAAADTEPPPASDAMDGGLRPSPLNPTRQELPGGAGIDAATPLDYDRLLSDIAALRARVAAVSDNLYQSRVSITLQTDGAHGKIVRLAVSLDDGIVWTAPSGTFSAPDMTTVYDHAVAPGRHAVTVDVDRKDDREEAFRTTQRSRFTVDVPRDHKVDVEVKILDDSSMGGDFPSDRRGQYDLRFRVKAVAKPARR